MTIKSFRLLQFFNTSSGKQIKHLSNEDIETKVVPTSSLTLSAHNLCISCNLTVDSEFCLTKLLIKLGHILKINLVKI